MSTTLTSEEHNRLLFLQAEWEKDPQSFAVLPTQVISHRDRTFQQLCIQLHNFDPFTGPVAEEAESAPRQTKKKFNKKSQECHGQTSVQGRHFGRWNGTGKNAHDDCCHLRIAPTKERYGTYFFMSRKMESRIILLTNDFTNLLCFYVTVKETRGRMPLVTRCQLGRRIWQKDGKSQSTKVSRCQERWWRRTQSDQGIC